jgi:Tat protein secretion system quality control protein TatD with DNase activity
MVYLIQGYFAPCHFLEGKYILFIKKVYFLHLENWKQQFSTYMEHQVVYGVVGMHPLYAHHLDLKMELNIRRCISHPKVKGVGEIGLDYLR